MEASNMLDVIHFYLEEDFAPQSQEAIKIRSLSRESLYESLYGIEYQFPVKDGKSAKSKSFDVEDLPYDNEDEDPVTPFNPEGIVKPYIPPTPVSPSNPLPFGDAVDAPLG
jgi:hypothetical protein